MVESKRWAVNYTKHVHQKRKVYHDGELELNFLSKKVMLYDDTEKLLDSRFLKKEEVVEYGGALAFESYLVDIGEPMVEQNSLTESEVSGTAERSTVKDSSKEKVSKKSTFLGKNKWNIQHYGNDTENHSDPMQTGTNEWDALYTTQVTQRAKRYHDGVLQLKTLGSYMNKVTLLSEDGTVLGSKNLKSGAFLKTGVTFELSNYLVQIGESRNCQQQGVPAVKLKQLNTIQKERLFTKRSLHEDCKKDISKEPLEVGSSGNWRGPKSMETVERKPHRDVSQILLNLQGRKTLNQKEIPVEVQSEQAKQIALDMHCQSNNIEAPHCTYVGSISEGGSSAESGEVQLSNAAQTFSVNTCSRSPTTEAASAQSTTVSMDHTQQEAPKIFQVPPLFTPSPGFDTAPDVCRIVATQEFSSGAAVRSYVEDDISKESCTMKSSAEEGTDCMNPIDPPRTNSSPDIIHSSKVASGDFPTKSTTELEGMPTFDLGF